MTELRLHRRKIVGMDAAPPEIRALQVVARLVAQQVLDVPADEGRSEVARGFEAGDYRRRRREQALDLCARLRDGLFSGLARRDVAPRADDLGRLTALVVDEAQLVADPTVSAVLLEKAVLDVVAACI